MSVLSVSIVIQNPVGLANRCGDGPASTVAVGLEARRRERTVRPRAMRQSVQDAARRSFRRTGRQPDRFPPDVADLHRRGARPVPPAARRRPQRLDGGRAGGGVRLQLRTDRRLGIGRRRAGAGGAPRRPTDTGRRDCGRPPRRRPAGIPRRPVRPRSDRLARLGRHARVLPHGAGRRPSGPTAIARRSSG